MEAHQNAQAAIVFGDAANVRANGYLYRSEAPGPDHVGRGKLREEGRSHGVCPGCCEYDEASRRARQHDHKGAASSVYTI